jgi:hypothetical protein
VWCGCLTPPVRDDGVSVGSARAPFVPLRAAAPKLRTPGRASPRRRACRGASSATSVLGGACSISISPSMGADCAPPERWAVPVPLLAVAARRRAPCAVAMRRRALQRRLRRVLLFLIHCPSPAPSCAAHLSHPEPPLRRRLSACPTLRAAPARLDALPPPHGPDSCRPLHGRSRIRAPLISPAHTHAPARAPRAL